MTTKASNGTVFRIFSEHVLVFSVILLFDHYQKLKFPLIYIIRPKSDFFAVPKIVQIYFLQVVTVMQVQLANDWNYNSVSQKCSQLKILRMSFQISAREELTAKCLLKNWTLMSKQAYDVLNGISAGPHFPRVFPLYRL